jgi:hypothetical protein
MKQVLKARSARAAVLAAVTVLAVLVAPAVARADTVTEWNATASTALFSPPLDARVGILHLAMVQGAVYDAVNAIDGGYRPYLVSPQANPWDSTDAAAATAAYRVLISVVPGQQPTLEPLYLASLEAIEDGPAKEGGIAAGEEAAAAMIAARENDGRFGTPGFTVPAVPLPGQWRPVLPAFVNDPNAWIKDVTPFLIQSSDQFRSRGPYALTSRKYAKEFNQVKELGSSTSATRSDEQTHAALYWAENPPRTWGRITRTISQQQGLSQVENARYFAMIWLTAADAFISVWDDKAHWSFWRPITAIREADIDGNPATEPDTGWVPLIPTPPYPDHPSGHAGLSGSIVKTLQQFFRTDEIGWTDTNVGGLTQSFDRFSQAIDEIVLARVWSGIHFLNPDQDGAHIGRQVAKYRQKHYFHPLHGQSHADADEAEEAEAETED